MPLDAAALIVLFRSDMSDPELPGAGDDSDSLWSDAEITEWMGEAQRELCERVDLLFDRSNFSIDTIEEQDLYPLDDAVTKIRRGVVETTTVDPDTGATYTTHRKLVSLSIAELERQYQPNDWDYNSFGDGLIGHEWEGLVGIPKYMVTDFEVGMLRLVPVPPRTAGGILYTGTHTSATPSATVLTDANANGGSGWVVNELVGQRVTHTASGASAFITANDSTTITATLSSGQWNQNDTYNVTTTATEKIRLDVYRTPLDPAVLEIPDKHRRMLLHKVKAFAYRKDDIDTQDLNRAILQEQRWETALDDADRQFKRLNRGTQVTSYGGISFGSVGIPGNSRARR